MTWNRVKIPHRKKRTMTTLALDRLRSIVESSDIVFGIDEAGWGPLAGPLSYAIVMMTPAQVAKAPDILQDSKSLTEEERERGLEFVKSSYKFYNTYASEAMVSHGAGHARDTCIRELVEVAEQWVAQHPHYLNPPKYTIVLDGSHVPKDLKGPGSHVVAIPKADVLFTPCAAASIVAKVWRDHQMLELHKLHPQYGWNENKGYATKKHLEALKKWGPTRYHRFNIKCVQDAEKPQR